jgi:hypothetical protein
MPINETATWIMDAGGEIFGYKSILSFAEAAHIARRATAHIEISL